MIAKFRIGYAPDSGFLLRDRLKDEFSEEVLRESGLFSWKESFERSPESRAPSPESKASGRRCSRAECRGPSLRSG